MKKKIIKDLYSSFIEPISDHSLISLIKSSNKDIAKIDPSNIINKIHQLLENIETTIDLKMAQIFNNNYEKEEITEVFSNLENLFTNTKEQLIEFIGE